LSSIPFLDHLPPDLLIPRGTEPTSKSPAVPSLFGPRPARRTRPTPRVADRGRDQRRRARPPLSLSLFISLPSFFLFLSFFSHFLFLLFPLLPSPSLSFLLPRALGLSSLSAPERRPAALPLPAPLRLAWPPPSSPSLVFRSTTQPDLAPRPRAPAVPRLPAACARPRPPPPGRSCARGAPLSGPARTCPRRVPSTAEALTRTRMPSPRRTAPATMAQCRLRWSPPRVTSPSHWRH